MVNFVVERSNQKTGSFLLTAAAADVFSMHAVHSFNLILPFNTILALSLIHILFCCSMCVKFHRRKKRQASYQYFCDWHVIYRCVKMCPLATLTRCLYHFLDIISISVLCPPSCTEKTACTSCTFAFESIKFAVALI